jgi:hypothetical protein
VAELDQASKSLGTGAGSAFQNNDQLGAVRLLSQRNFDAIQYSTEANNLTLDVSHKNVSFLLIYLILFISLGRFMLPLQKRNETFIGHTRVLSSILHYCAVPS